MTNRSGARDRQRGASLVEFAIVLPLLIVLLFGIIEFGWGMAQQVDIRHKAREALRVAIVDGTTAEIESRVCGGDLITADAITSIARAGGTDVGDNITVTIEADLAELTGFFGWVWGPNPTISSTVEGRVEQEATEWPPPGELAPCP